MMKTSGKDILVAVVGLTALVCGGLLLAGCLHGWLEQVNAWLDPATGLGARYATDIVLGA